MLLGWARAEKFDISLFANVIERGVIKADQYSRPSRGL
jgi:hypothetical protein